MSAFTYNDQDVMISRVSGRKVSKVCYHARGARLHIVTAPTPGRQTFLIYPDKVRRRVFALTLLPFGKKPRPWLGLGVSLITAVTLKQKK